MGDLVTTGVSARHGGRPDATRPPCRRPPTRAWALGVACGLLVALAGYLTTTARARATPPRTVADEAEHAPVPVIPGVTGRAVTGR